MDTDVYYAWVRHHPEGTEGAHLFAAKRWRKEGELFDEHAFIACEEGARSPQQAKLTTP